MRFEHHRVQHVPGRDLRAVDRGVVLSIFRGPALGQIAHRAEPQRVDRRGWWRRPVATAVPVRRIAVVRYSNQLPRRQRRDVTVRLQKQRTILWREMNRSIVCYTLRSKLLSFHHTYIV